MASGAFRSGACVSTRSDVLTRNRFRLRPLGERAGRTIRRDLPAASIRRRSRRPSCRRVARNHKGARRDGPFPSFNRITIGCWTNPPLSTSCETSVSISLSCSTVCCDLIVRKPANANLRPACRRPPLRKPPARRISVFLAVEEPATRSARLRRLSRSLGRASICSTVPIPNGRSAPTRNADDKTTVNA